MLRWRRHTNTKETFVVTLWRLFTRRTLFAHILHFHGFGYKKYGIRKVLWKRRDNVALSILTQNGYEQLDRLMFSDEIWISDNRVISSIWITPTASKRGGRIVVCHVGSVRVFVSPALYTFPWNKTGIHIEVMAANVCGMGLEEKLICNSPALSGNMMDSATHHWAQYDNAPALANRGDKLIIGFNAARACENLRASVFSVHISRICLPNTSHCCTLKALSL